MRRTIGRERECWLGNAWGLALLTIVGCSKSEPVPMLDAAVNTATAAVSGPAPSETASTPTAVRPPDDEPETVTDAGSDAGVRPRRRLTVARDAGLVETQTAAPPPPAPTPEPTHGKHLATPMSNDQPYGGGSAPSAAPALTKTRLPDDDPWKKPDGSK